MRLTIRHTIVVPEERLGSAFGWLDEQDMTRFINREVTPVTPRTFMYFQEAVLNGKASHVFCFYEDKIAMLFKLTYGGT